MNGAWMGGLRDSGIWAVGHWVRRALAFGGLGAAVQGFRYSVCGF